MLKLLRGPFSGKASYGLEKLFLWVLDGELGMGQTSGFLKDRWLPDVGGGKILSPGPNLPRDATVETLIDGDSTYWNFQLIDKTFLPFEASGIKVIPLCLKIMLFIQNQTHMHMSLQECVYPPKVLIKSHNNGKL